MTNNTPEAGIEELKNRLVRAGSLDPEERVLNIQFDDVIAWLRTTLHHQLQKAREEERERSTKLWDMLDHIDTIPDMMHPNTPEAHEKCWRYMVEVAHKRHSVLKSDGYTLDHSELDQDITFRSTFEITGELANFSEHPFEVERQQITDEINGIAELDQGITNK